LTIFEGAEGNPCWKDLHTGKFKRFWENPGGNQEKEKEKGGIRKFSPVSPMLVGVKKSDAL